jgi:hypothetical protein
MPQIKVVAVNANGLQLKQQVRCRLWAGPENHTGFLVVAEELAPGQSASIVVQAPAGMNSAICLWEEICSDGRKARRAITATVNPNSSKKDLLLKWSFLDAVDVPAGFEEVELRSVQIEGSEPAQDSP